MKNQSYVRITLYRPPPNTAAARLARLASVSEPAGIVEGFLLDDITVRTPVRLRLRFRDGVATGEEFTSAPVNRIEDGYVQAGADAIYQVLRVPGPQPQRGAAKSATNAPVRTTVSAREYFTLRESLFGAMADIAPDLSMVAALFRLHSEQFAKVRRDLPDERSGEPFPPVDLDAEFTAYQDALCYRYSSPEKRNQREREMWIAGHQLLNALRDAISNETAYLAERGHLALFTGCHARLMRLLQAWQHFASLVPAPEAAHGQD